MPRIYKRVTDRNDVSEANMKLAIESVLSKELSIRKSNVKPGTLQHRLEKKKKENELPSGAERTFENKFTNKQVFCNR